MTAPITVQTLIEAMSALRKDGVPESLSPLVASGKQALERLLAQQAAEREAALRADIDGLRSYFDLDALDDYLDNLVEALAIELSQQTSPELAAITEETGGRTVARMRRAMASELLKMRLA